ECGDQPEHSSPYIARARAQSKQTASSQTGDKTKCGQTIRRDRGRNERPHQHTGNSMCPRLADHVDDPRSLEMKSDNGFARPDLRRLSANCHASRPGSPSKTSRMRLMSERASAVSGEIPNKLHITM